MEEEFFEKLREKVKPYFEGINPCHDMMHTDRVLRVALHVAEKENADLEIVGAAVLLHDIARKEQDESKGKVCHATRGAELAREILEEMNYPENKIEKVIHCVRTHRSKESSVPESVEAKVLHDADKIDCIGAIGVLRSASFSGYIGSVVHNPDVNLETAKCYSKEDSAYFEFLTTSIKTRDRMMTKTGKELACERHNFMVEFFDRVNKEVEGEW